MPSLPQPIKNRVYSKVVFSLNGVESEPLYNIQPNDPINALQTGDVVEAYFKSLNATKKLIILTIDVIWNPATNGQEAFFWTEEYHSNLSSLPPSTKPNDDDYFSLPPPLADIEDFDNYDSWDTEV